MAGGGGEGGGRDKKKRIPSAENTNKYQCIKFIPFI